MSNLYQDAILDARALRASAIANAKAALEEAFEPKIQEMLRAKLSEEEVSEIAEAEEIKEEAYEDGMEEGVTVEETVDITNEELDGILAELEELEQVEEAKHSGAEHDKLDEAKEEGEEEAGEEGKGAEAEEVVDDETKVIDITLGDLKRVMLSAQQQMMGAQAGLDTSTEEPTKDSEAEAAVPIDEISLDEILDELEAEGMEKTAQNPTKVGPEAGEQLEAEGASTVNEIGADVDLATVAAGIASVIGSGVGLAGLQAYLKKKYPKAAAALEKLGSAAGESTRTMGRNEGKDHAGELKEAKATIETLRKDLQEVNLLNAKYLYMNKLFKSKSLTESQKVKVINALDRATTVVEVKNTYETLRESFETKKQTIKESIGFASKPAGVAPKANIVEADGFISRWQKLAGIKK